MSKFIHQQQNKINDLQLKIAHLEAKLAESEKKFVVANNLRKNSDEVLLNYKTEKYGLDKTIQELRKMKLNLPEKEWYYKGFENCERQMSSHIADLTLEVKELKQQLAEKEKEIISFECVISAIRNSLKEVRIFKVGENQDKISFAIEQLEKVKEHNNNLVCDDEDYYNYITAFIDNQIKQLKEGDSEK